jgi:hypothetical protein
MEQPDPRLLRQAQRGDAQAFAVIVRHRVFACAIYLRL